MFRRKADEVKILEETIRHRSEQQRKAGAGLEATCQICLKTKFADGVGHVCAYCGIRCCARCGGKVTLRSSKVIWVCILCRKKQELLIKTGQWIQTPPAGSTPEKENRGPMGSLGTSPQTSPSRFAPPLQRASSLQNHGRELPTPSLRRQYSQENRGAGPSFHHPHLHHHLRRSSSTETHDYYPPTYRDREFGLGYAHNYGIQQDSNFPPPSPAPSGRSYAPLPQASHLDQSGRFYGNDPQNVNPHDYAMSSGVGASQDEGYRIGRQNLNVGTSQPRVGRGSGSSAKGQGSLSSSEEELRSTPDSGDEFEGRRRRGGSYKSRNLTNPEAQPMAIGSRPPVEPIYRNLRSVEAEFHNQAPVEGTTPPERRRAGYTDRRQKKTVRFDSDDFGDGPSGRNEEEWFLWDQSGSGGTQGERQGSQDSTTRDSGIDTCSNFTSSEDSNRDLIPTKVKNYHLNFTYTEECDTQSLLRFSIQCLGA